MLPAAQANGVGVIAWSPLHGGLLGGVIRKQNEGKRRLEGRAAETLDDAPRRDRGVRGLRRGARPRAGRPRPRLAAAPSPGVTGPIIGPRTQEQLDAAACARSTSTSTRRRSPGSTRSSRATRRRPRTTPGDPGHATERKDSSEDTHHRRRPGVSAIGLGGMPMSIEGRPDGSARSRPSTPRSTRASPSSTPPTPTTCTPTRSATTRSSSRRRCARWGGDTSDGARRHQGRPPAPGRRQRGR